MRDYLKEPEAMGRDLAAMGIAEKQAAHLLLLNLRSGPATTLAMRAYRAAQPAAFAA